MNESGLEIKSFDPRFHAPFFDFSLPFEDSELLKWLKQ